MNWNRVRKLSSEQLECRRVLAASLGWDGPGQGSVDLQYYIGDAPSYLEQSAVNNAIETALGAWSDAADITFTQTDSPGQLDTLDFRFRNLDGAGGTLARAYFPDDVNPARVAGDVEFDLGDRWEIGNDLGQSAFDLVSVAVHEIGHSLGLGHIHESESILAPTISANEVFAGLSSHDIEAIQELYSSETVASEPLTDNDSETPITDPANDEDSQPRQRENPWNRMRWFTRLGDVSFRIVLFNGSSEFGGMQAEVLPAFNRYNPADADGNGHITAKDALMAIDAVNRNLSIDEVEGMIDANGDNQISPIDPLIIIAAVNGNEDESKVFAPEEDTSEGELSDESNSNTDDEGEVSSSDSEEDAATDESSENDESHRRRPYLPLGLGPLGFGQAGFIDSAVDSLFESFDENSDGSLTQNEIPEFAWNYLNEHGVDADNNGQITLDEIDSALESYRLDRFNDFDENADGSISSGEVPEFVWRRIENADTDNSEGVSFDELESYRMLTRFQRLDDNGDGSITQDEVSERMWERLSRYDENQDGAVVESELPERPDFSNRFSRIAEMAARIFRMTRRWT